MEDPGWAWPLLLSTGAGLSTAIGAVLAVSTTPCEATLAFLLGTAIGVMATVSGLELWWHKARETGDFLGISAAVAGGAVLFAVLDPLLPKPPEHHTLLLGTDGQQEEEAAHVILHLDSKPQVTVATGLKRNPYISRQPSATKLVATSSPRAGPLLPSVNGSGLSSLQQDASTAASAAASAAADSQLTSLEAAAAAAGQPGPSSREHQLLLLSKGEGGGSGGAQSSGPSGDWPALLELRSHHAGLMRLGLIMAGTMTLHNLPEGAAVAFSSFSAVGVKMALAIAIHNVAEGCIIAAPIFAATGSRARAVAIATASGLSEPLGALVALLVFRPFVSSLGLLDYLLAAVGGIMLAVCALELWPEGRRCQQHTRLGQGILLGSVVMAWTLQAGA